MKKILLVLCVLAASITNGRAYWGLQPECPSTYHLTLIANPMDCSAYYVCESGIPVPMGCTEGLYFCAEKSICTWVWEPGCSFDCQIIDGGTLPEVVITCSTWVDYCPGSRSAGQCYAPYRSGYFWGCDRTGYTTNWCCLGR